MMSDNEAFTFEVQESDAGIRFDSFVSSHVADCSRSLAATLIRNGEIRIRGVLKKPGCRLRIGDEITGRIPAPEPVSIIPEPLELAILYEDNAIIVINKQAGLVVHPAPGNYTGTLVNGLLHLCPDLGGIGGEQRPGIVHRLDKDTTGALVVAKNAAAHENLAFQFKSRTVSKNYVALVHGRMKDDAGTIRLPIGRHPVDRKKMSTFGGKSRQAETKWRVRERLDRATLIDVDLKTGRTHQIRVHMAAIGHPVVGDEIYGPNNKARNGPANSATRQMLHARCLKFSHPISQKQMSFEAPIPEDMEELIHKLRLA